MVYCKILIIDDDQDDVEILSEAFKKGGVDCVHHVNSAVKAFLYLAGVKLEYLPKLIVTELYLPGMTGEEFLKDLKRKEVYKHIHVVLLSSEKSEKEIERYRELGALYHITKPCSFAEYLKVAADIKCIVNL